MKKQTKPSNAPKSGAPRPVLFPHTDWNTGFCNKKALTEFLLSDFQIPAKLVHAGWFETERDTLLVTYNPKDTWRWRISVWNRTGVRKELQTLSNLNLTALE